MTFFEKSLTRFISPKASDTKNAALLGIPLMTYRHLKLDGSNPTEKTIQKIATALGKTHEEIRYPKEGDVNAT